MAITKPSIPKGTRDFGPSQVQKRQYIIQIMRSVFEKFGFAPIETPAMENLSVLTGKYGDEGDQLLFKILNSGDFLSDSTYEDFEKGSSTLLPKITKKGLRYDLTVPFARYVVMNQSEISFPFKRYQIQPVWRSDRPQKGRYQEFYQCDADVVGTNSLLCEAEVVMMMNEVLEKLKITNYTIKINNRKILEGICEVAGASDKFNDIVVSIDKLDKIGEDGVRIDLNHRGVPSKSIDKVLELIDAPLKVLNDAFETSETGKKGVLEVDTVFSYLNNDYKNYKFDATLARGLSYYTGCIFEVVVNNVSIGSISGGGRYDDLTAGFGLKDVSGVGFSFGLDRIYDVMNELNLFEEHTSSTTKALIIPFDDESFKYSIGILNKLRTNDINTELYPDIVKLKKSMNYANDKQIPFVILIGEEEINSDKLTIKNMESGEQEKLSLTEIIKQLK